MRVLSKRLTLTFFVAALGVAACVFAEVPADAANQVWTVASTPGLGLNTMVESVDCVASGWCVAVGSQRPGSASQSLIAMGDGSQWSVAPNPDPHPWSYLYGASCVSTRFCVAVGLGLTSPGVDAENTIEQWDGARWTNVPSPQVDLGHPQRFMEGQNLKAVSCVSESWCAAVGEYGSFSDNDFSFSFLLWDGTSWSITAAPLVVGTKDRPNDISCTSPTSCVAVGTSQTGQRSTGVLWRWDGVTWTRDSMPDTGLPDSMLQSVSCVTSTWCSAVGIRADGSVPGQTLDVVWDGVAWSVVPTPNLDDQYNYLKGISCASSAACIAVGNHFGRIGEGGANGRENLIMSWDGSAWSVVPNVPYVDPTTNTPIELACVGSTCPSESDESSDAGSLFLAGSGGNGPQALQPSSVSWINTLYGVSCFSASGCRATGNAESGATSQAFLLVWNGELATYGPKFTG